MTEYALVKLAMTFVPGVLRYFGQRQRRKQLGTWMSRLAAKIEEVEAQGGRDDMTKRREVLEMLEKTVSGRKMKRRERNVLLETTLALIKGADIGGIEGDALEGVWSVRDLNSNRARHYEIGRSKG